MFAAISGLPVTIRISAIVRRDDCTGGASVLRAKLINRKGRG